MKIKHIISVTLVAALCICVFALANHMDNKQPIEPSKATTAKSNFHVGPLPEDSPVSILKGKKIIYDGDSIAMGLFGDGGYAQMVANLTEGEMENFARGGGKAGFSYRRSNLPLGC